MSTLRGCCCSDAVPSPWTAPRPPPVRHSSGCSRARCLEPVRRGRRCGGRRAFTSPCSCTASMAWRRDSICSRRADSALPRLRAAFNPEFAWTAPVDGLPLWLLQAGDYRSRSQRISCDQEIAADGFFSLGMIADFDASLDEYGPSFYRNLFWESGVVGQMLYLEAEAAGARGTGIGCFFDDPMHQLLGVNADSDHAFQSLYHFTVGMPVEDTRLTTEPGYPVWINFRS